MILKDFTKAQDMVVISDQENVRLVAKRLRSSKLLKLNHQNLI